jgi:thioredoxin 1
LNLFKAVITEYEIIWRSNQSDKPVLVDFYATWCGPCKLMGPILQRNKGQYGRRITILKIDVDKNPEISHQFEVQGVPTLMIFKQGKVKWRQSGVDTCKTTATGAE